MVESVIRRQERLGISELALMDIDANRMEIIGGVTAPLESRASFKITRTTDPKPALEGADYVITTFRVGGIESRVIDERVPLELGVLGQETTGPGGFAMGMRSIPVLLSYVKLMRELCPDAWLINFANPAGMMAESIRKAGWTRAVGICDGPVSILRVAAAVIGKPVDEVYLDYFGLNHLGWVRSVVHNTHDYLPQILDMIQSAGAIAGLPFDPLLIRSLGMIPNEYLYYYYYDRQAVHNILQGEETRGEQITRLNRKLYGELRRLLDAGQLEEMTSSYQSYLNERGSTYMARETGQHHEVPEALLKALEGEGYAGVALDLIEGLTGDRPARMILNIPNEGAITGMDEADVVEIPAIVSKGFVKPLPAGAVPDLCLGLMKQVKAYERLTIAAATEGSYPKALLALTIHPLVRDGEIARKILDGYIQQHVQIFPRLN
jgi:6-phospho-beta-glucosidase